MRANLERLLSQHSGSSALPAFTCDNIEAAIGVIEAADAAASPLCILLSGKAFVGRRGELLCRALVALADAAAVPACVQLDHVSDLSQTRLALDLGVGAIMADGSRGSDQDIASLVKSAVAAAGPYGASVEAELGRIEGDEDRADGAGPGTLTSPEQAHRFIQDTGASVLAVSIGNVHGTYRTAPRLDWSRLAAIHCRTGAHLALHGASGVSDQDIAIAIRTGIRKINLNTELRQRWFGAVAEALPGLSSGWQLMAPQSVVTNAVAEFAAMRSHSRTEVEMNAAVSVDVAPYIRRIATSLKGVERLGVAFSGGVDSSVLVALAAQVLGVENVVAILGVSPSLAADERGVAHKVAAFIGVHVVEVETYEGGRAAYQANGPDRCFHCKDELFAIINERLLQHYRLDRVAYGENADDAERPDRPGAQAAKNHRVLRPLVEAGLTKTKVRSIARSLNLPCADKPAAPCLASRIPHYQTVTPLKLKQIEDTESALRVLGFKELRVRHHGDIARIELPSDDLALAVTAPIRDAIREAARAAGFKFAVLDLGGVQSGAFTLPLVEVRHG